MLAVHSLESGMAVFQYLDKSCLSGGWLLGLSLAQRRVSIELCPAMRVESAIGQAFEQLRCCELASCHRRRLWLWFGRTLGYVFGINCHFGQGFAFLQLLQIPLAHFLKLLCSFISL
jgi:hypothetical protein